MVVKVNRRDRTLKVRVTEVEHKQLLTNAGDQPLAEWLRETGLGQQPQQPKRRARRLPPPPDVDPALLRELVAQGNNLNQIARLLNSAEWGPMDRVQIIARLAAIEAELTRIREQSR